MKPSKTARFEELMRLKQEFNEKLKESFERYEARIKQRNSNLNRNNPFICKSPTSVELCKNNLPMINNVKSKKLLPLNKENYTEEIEDEIKKRRECRSQTKIDSVIWRPPYMVGNYFEKFKRLRDKHEITDWEKVINIKLILIYIVKSKCM
jgi:hypothetical protein